MKRTKWTKNTVTSILRNEKYKGDAILQKTYVKNFLDHKTVKNNGELPKYIVENSHPAIIDRDMWEMVQYELKRRGEIGASYSAKSIFSSKIVCGDCGGFYGRKIWHSTEKWSKAIYQCNKKYARGKERCQTPFLTEEEIKSRFIEAYNKMMVDKEQVLEDAEEIIALLTDTSEIDSRITESESEMEVVSELVKNLIRENAAKGQDQKDYSKKYNELEIRYQKAKERHDGLVEEKSMKQAKAIAMKSYLARLKDAEQVIDAWDDSLWMTVLEKAVVNRDGTITFHFTIGKNITLKI